MDPLEGMTAFSPPKLEKLSSEKELTIPHAKYSGQSTKKAFEMSTSAAESDSTEFCWTNNSENSAAVSCDYHITTNQNICETSTVWLKTKKKGSSNENQKDDTAARKVSKGNDDGTSSSSSSSGGRQLNASVIEEKTAPVLHPTEVAVEIDDDHKGSDTEDLSDYLEDEKDGDTDNRNKDLCVGSETEEISTQHVLDDNWLVEQTRKTRICPSLDAAISTSQESPDILSSSVATVLPKKSAVNSCRFAIEQNSRIENNDLDNHSTCDSKHLDAQTSINNTIKIVEDICVNRNQVNPRRILSSVTKCNAHISSPTSMHFNDEIAKNHSKKNCLKPLLTGENKDCNSYTPTKSPCEFSRSKNMKDTSDITPSPTKSNSSLKKRKNKINAIKKKEAEQLSAFDFIGSQSQDASMTDFNNTSLVFQQDKLGKVKDCTAREAQKHQLEEEAEENTDNVCLVSFGESQNDSFSSQTFPDFRELTKETANVCESIDDDNKISPIKPLDKYETTNVSNPTFDKPICTRSSKLEDKIESDAMLLDNVTENSSTPIKKKIKRKKIDEEILSTTPTKKKQKIYIANNKANDDLVLSTPRRSNRRMKNEEIFTTPNCLSSSSKNSITPGPASSSSLKLRRKSLFDKKLSVALTGFHGDAAKQLKKQLIDYGATILEEANEMLSYKSNTGTIVLIAVPTEYRTLKFRYALSLGVPILHVDWLTACFKQRQMIPFDGFFVPRGLSVLSNKFKYSESRTTSKIFSEMTIAIYKDMTTDQEFFQMIHQILTILKAKKILAIDHRTKKSTADLIVSLSQNTVVYLKIAAQENIPVVDVEWVFECILLQKIVDIALPAFSVEALKTKPNKLPSVKEDFAFIKDKAKKVKIVVGDSVYLELNNKNPGLLQQTFGVIQKIENSDSDGDRIWHVNIFKRNGYSQELVEVNKKKKIIKVRDCNIKRKIVVLSKSDFSRLKYRDSNIFFK